MSLETTQTWRNLLSDLLELGNVVEQRSPGAEWRGRTSRELLSYQTQVDMSRAVVASPTRKLSYRFLAAEAAWILSGDNRLETIAPYARQLKTLSDDGLFMGGAYGPPFVEQLPHVIKTLRADPSSRQAVVTIWRPRPASGKDTPCTISLQWVLRPPPAATIDPKLNCIATMRSSDAWLGFPYDIHAFSMMSAVVALYLRPLNVQLGTLYLTAGSQHLYLLDEGLARQAIEETDVSFDVKLFDLNQFNSPENLVMHLWDVANRVPWTGKHDWLVETLT